MIKKILTDTTKERKIKVGAGQTTSFLWEGENVFSTPSMIAEMEETCRLLLKEEFLQDEDWDSVGTLVNIRHLKATPVGTEVKLKARVIDVKDKRVTFEVDAFDKIEKIGEGLHERTVINVPEFRERFNKKLKKLETL
ncbi:MAG: thioesterase family protein [Nitrososphaeraceae archaeon]|nr:thioesterase family protein [Nitrososphaeraceae archaeon]MDW0201526.1 thioesterase family protein [Nitrososphaeraceae archaeon]MDW0214884.1 thioesterase family protein [Nitrososphaeraceae archaeon]MDW0255172.1 thioesterase family protein [Nitrososphaeraceae archaeon]